MPSELHVFNPSPLPRGGCVTVDWQPIYERFKIEPERLVLLDANGNSIPCQIDPIDRKTPWRAALSFLHERLIEPMVDDYLTPSTSVFLTEGAPSKADDGNAPWVDIHESHLVLHNSKLVVKFNLTPKLASDPRTNHAVYAGAATSVELHYLEQLDCFSASFGNKMQGHDLEKRCMQIDYIRLANPAWEWSPYKQINLYNRPYRVVNYSNGPVRACVTIAAEPFYYKCFYPHEREVECELYRVLSLYKDADYVLDELFINTPERDLQLHFTAQYFSYMNMGSPFTAHYENVPDWFVIAWPYSPFQGYGFATDVHARRIANPHPGFPLTNYPNRSFSWQLFRSSRARSIHIFMRLGLDTNSHDQGAVQYEFTQHAGNSWHDYVFKPLTARIPNEGDLNGK